MAEQQVTAEDEYRDAGSAAGDATPEPEGEALCALDGCDNPLPPPAVDEHGRRKGGRPSTYCCKAHADAASRARRIAQAAAVVEPLAELRRAAELFEPAAAPVLEALREMSSRLAAAERGALAQVRAAEQQAAAAREDAEEARRRADQAERARNRALARARDDQAARAEADRAAHRAREEAERATREAWAQVAEHERARGAAEAAGAAAIQARDELTTELRTLRDTLAAERRAHQQLAGELDATRHDLRELTAAHALQEERLATARDRLRAAEAAARTADQDADRARQETAEARAAAAAARDDVTTLRAELTDLHTRWAEEHTERRVAESRAAATADELAHARVELDRTRQELADAHTRLDRLLAVGPPASGPSADDPDTTPS
ncbi:hypothetical protein SAMN05421810_109142 [Amycolatopsis arida]|uniref:Chromosome segregation ATPase n=1 Tax=Amycolatopsis arida TaxID=587909 RepID=A0A1I5ZGA8_9PSEU|nr:hypothetical protein [Amycolatopsis arida]TDX89620.1 hypothetical protein CLV69_109141 [Amycolatopsis arida]SFQ55147.1 hypothetical protein SAMN05421810_109142 [Amycolatopsis arida]